VTATFPQRAAGVSRTETRGESRGESVLQPTIFTRVDGTQLKFASVESFRLWWDVQQRSKAEADEIAGRA
jgi:hypothetical protein